MAGRNLFAEKSKGRNLEAQIESFLAVSTLSPELATDVDILRQMGNFVHLNESFFTGEIVDISGQEAG